jgi:hypothetical protein
MMSVTKNKTHYRYYLIKDSVKNKYSSDEVEFALRDITCDSLSIGFQFWNNQVVC